MPFHFCPHELAMIIGALPFAAYWLLRVRAYLAKLRGRV